MWFVTKQKGCTVTMRDIKYFISQALRSFFRNGLMTTAAVFTVVGCLFIVGIFTVLLFNVRYMSDRLQNQCEIQVFIEDGTDEGRVAQMQDEIKAVANVQSAELFSKKDTLEYVKTEMFEGKESALVGFEDDNPFRDSYKITLDDISQVAATVSALKQIPNVAEVKNEQETIDAVLSVSNITKNASLWIMLMLIIISVALISNTIKITVFNRRKEINIMKYIGATNRFIRMPFFFEGMTIGFVGALIAYGLISWAYVACINALVKNNLNFFELLPLKNMSLPMALIFLAMGIGIGALGSSISVRKHLHV